MSLRKYINNSPTAHLTGAITNTATSATVDALTGFPSSFPYTVTLGLGTAAAELVLVTNAVGTTLTITRNYDGQGAFAHPINETVDHVSAAIDFTEANTHINASSAVHGLTGAVVGTSDTQTLSNKTLTAPVANGGLTANGDTTHVAITGKSTVGGVKTLSLRNSANTEVASVDDAGNGAFNKVNGVAVPTSYTTEAAATTALGTPPAGALVWLTAPTTGPVGLYVWDTVPAAWVPVQTVQDVGFIGEAGSGTPVTLSTTSAFAGNAPVTFTLTRQTRVKISTLVRYNPGSTGARFETIAGYNTGGTAAIASFVQAGGTGARFDVATSQALQASSVAFGTVLLAAGTYTAYASVQRTQGGAGTDTANLFETLVEAVGNV